jgi:large subunit ribosomal protein L6
MSRIGKVPVTIPKGVTVAVADGWVAVSGSKGKLSRTIPAHVVVDVKEGEAIVSVDSPSHGNLHGMYRTLVDNMVKGVTEGFTRVLEIVGVGYKAEMKGANLFLTLGYSHPILFELPEGVKAEVEGVAVIKVTGTDKELVGETAARIRRLRKPDVYKNKGIRYRGERLIKKVGKAGGK